MFYEKSKNNELTDVGSSGKRNSITTLAKYLKTEIPTCTNTSTLGSTCTGKTALYSYYLLPLDNYATSNNAEQS